MIDEQWMGLHSGKVGRSLLTDFGLATLADRYYWRREKTPEELFARVACAYGSNPEHIERIGNYLNKLWFMPATPILSNGGTDRGLPISCFLSYMPDSMEGIRDTWSECVDLARNGGGLGAFQGWLHLRHTGSAKPRGGTQLDHSERHARRNDGRHDTNVQFR